MTREHVRPRFLDRSNPSGFIHVCMECNMQEAGAQEAEYRALAISKNVKPYKSFLEAMYELDAMLAIHLPDKKLSETMARILFATAITAMETYLSDTFINRVLGDEQLLRRCVESDPELSSRKLELGGIFKRREILMEEVKTYLTDLLFHNLAKIRLMYSAVLEVQFTNDLSAVFRAVQTRHDIVHRSGKSKSGSVVSVSPAEVRSLIKSLKDFIKTIEDQLAQKVFADDA